MHFTVVLRILGLLLAAYSSSMLPPIAVSLWYDDGLAGTFALSFLFMLGVGLTLWYGIRVPMKPLQARDGFLITAVFWSVLSLVSALPLLLISHMNLAQAVFEAVSGFTTTGATVISGLDHLPKSFLYYRQQLHFVGGGGIIVMAMAVLPMLGIGGMQLYRAEASGPMRDDKLTPRLAHTAKLMVYVYLGLTAACALAFWAGGMSLFDAIGHSFATVATGGFSHYDTSFGYFNSPLLEFIAIVFMLLGSLNFSIHYLALARLNPLHYWRDEQTRVFIGIVILLILLTTWMLLLYHTYPDLLTALRHASFQVVSIISSTGFLTQDYSQWPVFIPVLLLGSGFVGGCVGGTTGGLKIMRVILLYKQSVREILRLTHPNVVRPVSIGNRPVPPSVAEAVWGFAFLYMVSYLILSFLMMAAGLDALSAFAGVAACLNLVGPGLGDVTMSFSGVNDFGLWIGSFSMLLGRLEVFTLLVLLMPSFWYD